ncbi:MAG: hypothetical protein ACRELT_03915, partial [Longimicrobiales bacterium]
MVQGIAHEKATVRLGEEDETAPIGDGECRADNREESSGKALRQREEVHVKMTSRAELELYVREKAAGAGALTSYIAGPCMHSKNSWVLVVAVMLSFGTAAAVEQGEQPASARRPAASSAEEVRELAIGWALLAQGQA